MRRDSVETRGGNFRDKTIFLFEALEECENVTSRSRPSTSRRFERLLRWRDGRVNDGTWSTRA